MRLKTLAALCFTPVLGLGVTSIHAQGIITGSINGTVQDSTGAVIPGATVTATNTALGQTFTQTGSTSGEFTFSSLPIGDYTVTIVQSGFGELKLEHLKVETGKTLGLGVEKLQTGSAVETVEVSTARNLLETTQAQVTTTFDSEMIQDLPTGGGLDQLALLVPGVAATHGSNFSNNNGGGFSSNGQRGRSNNFEIDGQANNDNSIGGSQIFFQNQDAVQEVQVITNNFSAEYGRNMGSIVNYVTKSGTNSIHGTGFEYYTGNFLSSMRASQKSPYPTFNRCQPGSTTVPANCTPAKLPRFSDNTYGGTLGFPILKDKLFAFGSTLWSRNLSGAQVSTSGATYFPTPAGLAQLQAALPGNRGVAELTNFGPYAAQGGTVTNTGTVINELLIIPGRSTPLSVPFSQITRTYNPQSFDQEHLGRLDFQATQKDRFFLRYFYQNAPNVFAGGTFASGAYYNTGAISHSVGSDWTHTFGPRWVNQVRYSFQQSGFTFDGGGFPSCTIKNLAACPSTATFGSNTYNDPALITATNPTGAVTRSNQGLGLANNIPQGRIVKVSQVQDNATWNAGRHSITFGGEFDYQNSPNVFLPFINGGFGISSYANLFNGVASTLTLASGASPNIHFTEPDAAAYFQDDWKMTSSFTVNLGLRYEFFGQSLNLLNKLTVASQTGPNPQWDTTLSQNGNANTAATIFPLIPTFKKGFEPRLGFAFNPASMPKLVVRGGFAINFDPAFYNIALNSFSAAPIVNQSTFTGCNGTTVVCFPTAGFVNAAVHSQDDALNPSGGSPGQKTQTKVTPDFHNPYAESYTLGVQYQVSRAATVEVRYSGNHTIGNFQTFNGNPQVGPGTATATVGGVVTPGVANFNTGISGASTALVPAMSTYFPSVAGSYCTASSLTKYNSAADLGRQYCGQTLVRTRANTAFSNYNALQFSLNTRNLYGFTGSVNYTYGRQIDNSSEVFSANTGNTVAFAQNPRDINVGERGVGATNFKNITSIGLTYGLPLFRGGNKLLSKTVGGLRLNTLYTFNSGQPYTPAQSYNGTLAAIYARGQDSVSYGKSVFSTCDYNFNSAFTSFDVCRPFVGNPNAPDGTVGINLGGRYVDANGVAINRTDARYIVNNVNEELVQGTPFGNVPRNSAVGNSYNNVNLSAFKDFHVTERINLQLQVNLFNALNRAFYGTPDPLVDDASTNNLATFQNYRNNNSQVFGPTVASATGSRNVQLGAKVQF